VNPVVVVSLEEKQNPQNRPGGKTVVSSRTIKSLPAFMGEPDVLKSLQLLPGIQAGNEGTSGLQVRGGSADQNLILLDGVPVYNATHAFGLFSVFNADAVNTVEVLKSGFPASYGGRLSSVIDVRMKEGDKYNFHGEGGSASIFSKLTLEGPLKKGKSSFMVSARRTYVDLFIRPLLKLSDTGVDALPYFSDINVKANFPLGEKDHVYFSIYRGKDNFSTSETYYVDRDSGKININFNAGFDWGNTTAMVRWNREWTGKAFSNSTLTFSRYRFNLNQEDERQSSFKAYEYQFEAKLLFRHPRLELADRCGFLPVPDHYIKTGFAATVHRYEPGISSFLQQDTVVRLNKQVDNGSVTTGEYDLYAEDDIRLTSRMKLNAGIRFSGFNVRSKWFFSAQPRIHWIYRMTDHWAVKASYSYMTQFIHLLTNSNLGLPTDLWLPATDRLPPQRSGQVAGGLFYSQKRNWEGSMEVYYKSLKNVIEYAEGAGFGTAFDNWEDLVEKGVGASYGAEWMVQKKTGKLTGLISYTLSKSWRQFEKINEGNKFPYKYDRRHELKMAGVWQPSKRFEGSFSWLYSTGTAISLPEAYYYNPYTQRSLIFIRTGIVTACPIITGWTCRLNSSGKENASPAAG
jgi:outer membrane receptor for ferrienterochelin and colicin